ncbi:MAG: hypothetical protein KGL13_02495 [Gammaproteobacteria bacterium]|nr:hypothetical protein [Gammaproteobacteria bacterium]MDE2345315.1 hypothetical protein [Gammaproteobacteria bacterium]
MRAQLKSAIPVLAILGALFALSFPSLKLVLDAGTAAPAAQLTADGVRVLISVVLAVVACATFIGGRYSRLCFALYLYALSRAAQPAGLWTMLLPERWRWIAALPAALIAGSSIYGFVALCMRIPSGQAISRWRSVDRFLPIYAVLVAVIYGASVIPGFSINAYGVFAALIWIGYAIGLFAYLDRRRMAEGEELLRTRWVAFAIAAHVLIEATFLALNLSGHQQRLATYLFILNPAPYAFAYALVTGRIVDLRVFGGRALVYGLVTTFVIGILAAINSFTLKALPPGAGLLVQILVPFSLGIALVRARKLIEVAVERVLFAQRHRAHAAIEQMIVALPFVERTESIETMLVQDVREQLAFSCAAVYCSTAQGFELRLELGCDGLARLLDPDNPLVLYPRSRQSLVSLRDIPGLPGGPSDGNCALVNALPIVGGNKTYAIVFYGEHVSGEAVDRDEERLLLRLAHSAATAYAHLLLLERERQIAILQSQLDVRDSP